MTIGSEDEAALSAFLASLAAEMAAEADRGRVADYIPELASVDPGQFGVSVCLANGAHLSAGDASTPFSIQSVSKVFTLALALGRFGDQIWERVGREPSNNAFNSIVELELQRGKPRNPFVNAGAIVVSDALLLGRSRADALGEILGFVRAAADAPDIAVNERVAASESRTGDRNWSLAYFLRSCDNLQNACAAALDLYFHQCAIEMSCDQLAKAGRFLAGIRPPEETIGLDRIRRINALMLTCGHYDASGEFAFNVGLPGKSGVGGGILAVAPGVASIAVWSPGLNRYGNSALGARALRALSEFAGWSVFKP